MKKFMNWLGSLPGAVKGPLGVLFLFTIYYLCASLLGSTPVQVLFITMLMLFLTPQSQRSIESVEKWYRNKHIDATTYKTEDFYNDEDSFGGF